MKKFVLTSFICLSVTVFAQNTKTKGESKIVKRYEAGQPQDSSVPPPPVNTFPAQFPQGNKAFVKKVEQLLNKEALTSSGKNLNTQIFIKVDDDGNVLNVSTYGKNETFNNEVKAAAVKATDKIKWTAGKNSRGEKVIDLVKLPFQYKNQ
ncbi:MAG: hypothetical protein LBE92_16750 [Chryseobacterium sp.]|jgi:hypothetical protein|uniref:hypothetical protein n=1 Tax=Chryseobacterium sp. TaxID=1871047 RepID=UPI002828EFB6|nr:hypothetical protein [Chryseobacterium sp.]MDR2237773.1 hypothetical protein [Chryseobacterium sp.]